MATTGLPRMQLKLFSSRRDVDSAHVLVIAAARHSDAVAPALLNAAAPAAVIAAAA
jgi:hypothetical protein